MKNIQDILKNFKVPDFVEDSLVLIKRRLGLSCYGFLPSVYYERMVPHEMTFRELEEYAEITGSNLNRYQLKAQFRDHQNQLKKQYEENLNPNSEKFNKWVNSLR